jgi:type IX secretion system substrate protein
MALPGWDMPPGFNTTSPGPSFISSNANQSGIYSVSVTDNLGCTATAEVMVTVKPKPTVLKGGTQNFCESTPMTAYANVTNDPEGAYGPYTYLWSNGQTTEKCTAGTICGGCSGPFPENVTVTNVYGCQGVSINSHTVFGSFNPAVTITTTGTPKCSGKTSTLTANATGGSSPYVYAWYTNNELNGQVTNTFTTGTRGNYKVKVTDNIGCTKISTAKTIAINPLPLASVTPDGPTSFCSGGSVNLSAPLVAGYTYVWKKGTTAISGATGSTYTATTAGSYNVKTTDANGCTKTSANTSVTVPCRENGELTGTTGEEGRMSAYPVPVTDVLNIDAKDLSGNGFIYVMNQLGQTVLTREVNFDLNESKQVDMSDFPAGIYTVIVKNLQTTQKISVVKE